MNFHFAFKKEWKLMIFILALQFLFKNTDAHFNWSYRPFFE